MELKVVFVLVIFAPSIFGDNATIDYYVNLITRSFETVSVFQAARDAREYLPKSSKTAYYGKFDFVVIGAGAAGSVLASRLSERYDFNVLALEAGDLENDFTDIPLYNNPLQLTKYNWGFVSVPQKTACLGMNNRICPFPRGKGVGGSSIINGMVYARGNPNDFDRWAAEGNPGWSYDEVLPYFKKSEGVLIPHADTDYHGTEGPWPVELPREYGPHLVAFLKANEEMGYDIVDYNGAEQMGASPVQTFSRRGIRISSGKAFVVPALSRKNLKVLTGAYATKILIDKEKKAYGVEFTYKNVKYVAEADLEIILSAGVVGSAQILQLSGVGPREFLKPHGIPVIQELDVGKNLKDHPTFLGLVFETNYTAPTKPLRTYVEEYLRGVGPLVYGANIQGLGFYRSKLARFPNVPDLEILFVPANTTNALVPRLLNLNTPSADSLNVNPANTVSFYLSILQMASSGSIKIRSKDPFEYPDIDPALLSDPNNLDIDALYEGVGLVLDMMKTKAFRRLGVRYAAKPLKACSGDKFMSKNYWYCALRQLTMYTYHAMGTCKMGPDPGNGAVVDSDLKVHGIAGLRVADFSVVPVTPAGHPTAVAVLIGEIAADLIKRAYPK